MNMGRGVFLITGEGDCCSRPNTATPQHRNTATPQHRNTATPQQGSVSEDLRREPSKALVPPTAQARSDLGVKGTHHASLRRVCYPALAAGFWLDLRRLGARRHTVTAAGRALGLLGRHCFLSPSAIRSGLPCAHWAAVAVAPRAGDDVGLLADAAQSAASRSVVAPRPFQVSIPVSSRVHVGGSEARSWGGDPIVGHRCVTSVPARRINRQPRRLHVNPGPPGWRNPARGNPRH